MGQSKLPFVMTPSKSPEKRYLDKEDNKENLDQSLPQLKKHKPEHKPEHVKHKEQEEPNTPIEINSDADEVTGVNTSIEVNDTESKDEPGDTSYIPIDKEKHSTTSTLTTTTATTENSNSPLRSQAQLQAQSKPKLTKEEREEIKKEKERLKEERKMQREKELEERRLKRQVELEEKRLQREKELEDRRLKKEKLEAEKKAKREQREQEKLDRQREREEQKIKRKAEIESKRAEIEAKKKGQEEEKLNTKKLEEEKKQKRSITNFFKVAKTTTPSKSDSLPAKSLDNQNISPESTPSKCGKSDYDSYFLPFYLNPNTRLINNMPGKDECDVLDNFIGNHSTLVPDFKSYLQSCNNPPAPPKYVSTFDVVQKINMGNISAADNLFKSMDLKYLKFYENKKIPYLGTYTAATEDQIRQLATNPFIKIESEKLDIEYEYDSDLDDESDEEGEGEDIDKEDEEEDDEETEDHSDVDEFVESDEAGETNMKKRIIGTLVPVTKWIGQETDSKDDEFGNYFNTLQYERLKSNITYPIDPFHDYWASTSNSQSEKKSIKSESAPSSGNSGFKVPTCTTTTTNTVGVSKTMTIKKKVITDAEDIKKLVDLIEKNKGFTINTLTEVVQKQVLSKYAKAVVKNSIKDVAVFDKTKNEWVIKK